MPRKKEVVSGTFVKYDAVVLGSGPAGEGAAMKLAKSGKRVAIVDVRERIDLRENVALPDDVACLNLSRDNTAKNPECEFGLHPRLNDTGKTHGLGTTGCHVHPDYGSRWRVFRCSGLVG